MEVVLAEGLDPAWDSFVRGSPGGTIFHTLEFLDYHPPSRFDFVHLAVKEEGRLVGVIPGGRLKVGGKPFYRSPLGASFGGFVFSADAGLKTVFETLDTFKAYLGRAGYAGAEVWLPPSCYSSPEDHGTGFAMLSSGYRLASREATAVIPLGGADIDSFDPALRRNLRKAEASRIEIGRSKDVRAFFEVLEANLAAKGATPTHTAGELEHLIGRFPDSAVLFEARRDGRLVGGCLCLICNERTALAFYICDHPDFRQYRVTEAVLYECMTWLKDGGYDFLDLGTISIDGKVNWGLARFKSKFMARTYVREKYRLNIEEAA